MKFEIVTAGLVMLSLSDAQKRALVKFLQLGMAESQSPEHYKFFPEVWGREVPGMTMEKREVAIGAEQDIGLRETEIEMIQGLARNYERRNIDVSFLNLEDNPVFAPETLANVNADELVYDFSMQTTNLGGDIITLEASFDEVRVLEVALRAGKTVDPFISHTDAEEAAALHQKMLELLNKAINERIEFRLTKREFLDMSSVLEALNVIGHTDYYPELSRELPSERDFQRFSEHVERLYDRAFRMQAQHCAW